MKIVNIFYDCECYKPDGNYDNSKIEAFVGYRWENNYTYTPLNEFRSKIMELRREIIEKYGVGTKIILVCYNYNYDGKLLHWANTVEEYTDAGAYIKSGDIISDKSGKGKKIEYPKLDRLFKNTRDLYFFDTVEAMAENAFTSIGSLEYHASKLGYKWRSLISGDIYLYNEDDLIALDLVHNNFGGAELAEVLIHIIDTMLRSHNYNLLSRKYLSSVYKKLRGITLNTKYPDTEEAFKIYRSKFNLGYSAVLQNKTIYFEESVDDGAIKRTNVIAKHPITLNYGGLHSGIKHCVWRAEDGYQLYVLDFSSAYPYAMCSEKFHLYSQGAKAAIKELINLKAQYKQAGKAKDEYAVKILVNIIYGFMAKEMLWSPKYITFLVQLSIVYMVYKFSKYADVLDINTDGITIRTKIGDYKVLELVQEVHQFCKQYYHEAPITCAKLSAIYYKDYNNYILVDLNDKVIKVKGQFISNRKLQKIKIPNEFTPDGSPKYQTVYNIVNYAEIIIAYLEKRELPRAIALGFVEGKKVQFFDGIPLYLTSITNPSISNATLKESGHTSAEDLAKACVNGFESHFLLSNNIKDAYNRCENIESLNTTLKETFIKNNREEGKLYIPYDNLTDLTIEYRLDNLYTFTDAIGEGKKNILIAFSTLFLPREINNVVVLDYDFKSITDKGLIKSTREMIWDYLIGLSDKILYAEMRITPKFDEETKTYSKSGIHAFVLREDLPLIKKKHAEYLDKNYLRKTARKDVTLYYSSNEDNKIQHIGNLKNIEDFIKTHDVHRSEKRVRVLSSNILQSKDENTEKDLLDFYNSIVSLPSDFNLWLKYISCFYNSFRDIGYTHEKVIDLLRNLSVKDDFYNNEETKQKNERFYHYLGDRYTPNNEVYNIKTLKLHLFTNTTLEKREEEKEQQIQDIINMYIPENMEELSSAEDFFKVTGQINLLKAATGTGKTNACIQAIIKDIINNFPILFITNTKTNAKFVYDSVMEGLPEDYKYNFSRLGFLLNSETSRSFGNMKHSLPHFIFTTYHYFTRSRKDDKLLYSTLKLSKLSDMKIYFDEIDEYLNGLEYCYSNKSRYFRKFHDLDHYDYIEYCPVAASSRSEVQLTAKTNMDVCKNCISWAGNHLSNGDVDNTYNIEYIPLAKIPQKQAPVFFNFESLIKETHNFKFLPSRNAEISSIKYKTKLNIGECDTNNRELVYFKSLFNHSYFTNIVTYYPTFKKNIVTIPQKDECDKYPHYPCNIKFVNGLDVMGLAELIKMINKRGCVLYGFSATINKNTIKILEQFNSKVNAYVTKKSYTKISSLLILYTSRDFSFDNAILDYDYDGKILCFFPRREDADAVYKKTSLHSSKIALFAGNDYSFSIKNLTGKGIKYILTYSRSTLSRGINFDSRICILDTQILKPFHSYVYYSDDRDYDKESAIVKLNYILQNCGRVLRSDGRSVLILSNCSKAIANFVSHELKDRAEEIIVDNVSERTSYHIMSKAIKHLNQK